MVILQPPKSVLVVPAQDYGGLIVLQEPHPGFKVWSDGFRSSPRLYGQAQGEANTEPAKDEWTNGSQT